MKTKWISGHAIEPSWPSRGGEQLVCCAHEAQVAIDGLRAALVALKSHPDAERYRTLRAKYAQELCLSVYGQEEPYATPADWSRELDEWVDEDMAFKSPQPERAD
jgi:hypothetical protein